MCPRWRISNKKLNLVLASGDLPDVFIGGGIPLDQQQILAEQGLIIPLNDLIEKYGKEFKTRAADRPGDQRSDHPAGWQDLRSARLQRMLPLQYVAEDVGLQTLAR